MAKKINPVHIKIGSGFSSYPPFLLTLDNFCKPSRVETRADTKCINSASASLENVLQSTNRLLDISVLNKPSVYAGYALV